MEAPRVPIRQDRIWGLVRCGGRQRPRRRCRSRFMTDFLFFEPRTHPSDKGSFSEAGEILRLGIHESESVVQEGHGGDLVSNAGWGRWAVFRWLSSFETLLCYAFSSLSLLFLLLFCLLNVPFHPYQQRCSCTTWRIMSSSQAVRLLLISNRSNMYNMNEYMQAAQASLNSQNSTAVLQLDLFLPRWRSRSCPATI